MLEFEQAISHKHVARLRAASTSLTVIFFTM